jgi:hypothetical protein
MHMTVWARRRTVMIPLVPTYIWPTDDDAFRRALTGYTPGLAIVTGDNSGPGNVPSAGLAARIASLNAAGWAPIGYVRLDYMQRPLLDVAADVELWRTWYPNVAGIFFDECPTQPTGALQAAQALESLALDQLGHCVFNAGTSVDASWFAALARSVIVTFEGTAATYATADAQGHDRAAHLVYAATQRVSVTSGFGATTTDGEPGDANPWDADGTAAANVAWNADRVVDIREPAPSAPGATSGGRRPVVH